VGDLVQVPLHGRRVTGWVLEVGDASAGFAAVDASRLARVERRLSCGPSPEVVDLSAWVAANWAGPRRAVLVSASPEGRVPRLGAAVRRAVPDGSGFSVSLLRRGPLVEPETVVRSALRHGPLVVVAPTIGVARRIAASMRADGASTVLASQSWAGAAAGVDVVVGARSAVLASAPEIGALVVIDEHDDALQEERSPTWHARDVAVERARRLGIPVVLHSPVPSPAALAIASPDVAHDERDAWPEVAVVDRDGSSLVTAPLTEVVRDRSRRVLCIVNTKGRSRLLACRACRSLATCEHCEAAVSQSDAGEFACGRCGARRPPVCRRCGASKMANLRPGVSRIVEELAAASGGREVAEIRANGDVGGAPILVGTEAALHRRADVDSVWFLDADQELAAPRYRAVESFLGSVVRAARLVGRGGTVAIQSVDPSSPVLAALAARDVDALAERENGIRRALGLPPFGVLARVVGDVPLPEPTLGAMATVVGPHEVLIKGASRPDVLEMVAQMRGSGRIRAYLDPPRV
jgi:primosomal protein N' (replication factor Y)